MFLTVGTDDYVLAATSADVRSKEAAMYEDSFSEGHIYWGRSAMIVAIATTLAYVLSFV